MNTRHLLFLASCVLSLTSVSAQEIDYSLPQTLPSGTATADVLGRNSEGILVMLTGRSSDWMMCYSATTLDIKWKKEITLTEKSTDVQEAYLLGDSVVVLYTANVHGQRFLKANLYSPRMNLLRNAKALDTVRVLLGDEETYQFTASTLHNYVMVYNQSEEFSRKKEINFLVFNNQLQTVRSGHIIANRFEVPELVQGYVSDNGDTYFVCGDNKARNYNNTYQYTDVGVYSQTSSGDTYTGTSQENSLLGNPLFKFDDTNNSWVLIGLYADKAGNEANGMYFLRSKLNDTTILAKHYMPFTEDFIADVTGQGGVKKSRGFFDNVPTDLIVRRDGGALFITETQTQYSENMASNRFSTMGGGPGMITNHFFYNDMVVFYMDSTGAAQWYQVLRKKQQSDNDGGFYLSYGLLIAPRQLWMVYNDRVGGANNLAGYAITPSGENKRSVLVDTDRKNLAPIPSEAKQIAPNVMVIPSLRKGFFQLIKITFPS